MTEQNDEAAYTKARTDSLKDNNHYPHKFAITKTFDEYIATYGDVGNGTRHETKVESLAGRVMEIRSAGKKLFFYTVQANNCTVQFMVEAKAFSPEAFANVTQLIKRGDVVGAKGYVGKSKHGELSLFPTEMILLTPCLKLMPKSHFGVKDEELRVQKRYLDLMINKESMNTFLTRSKIISFIRAFLDSRKFVEVQTPILSSSAGGATAKPFTTLHIDTKKNMYMRIAPELFLKKLVVGGMDRVYEIGQQFRNEQLDPTHQSEFCSLEYYMAYADYNDLMTMCEELVGGLVNKLHGGSKFKYQGKELDFALPFKRIDVMSELTKQTSAKFPEDLSTEDANKFLVALCDKFKVECSPPQTNARLLDKLIGHFIEPQCINPTFVCNHPMIMCPLAKWHRDNKYLTERFELFVNGTELANAYTELNDPFVQREQFAKQAEAKKQGDSEIPDIDASFVESLEWGLAPTGGFGMGVDRLVMLMTDKSKIKDVILFPM